MWVRCCQQQSLNFFRKAVASIYRDLDNLKAEWEMSRAVS
jgi:hypothetical protein